MKRKIQWIWLTVAMSVLFLIGCTEESKILYLNDETDTSDCISDPESSLEEDAGTEHIQETVTVHICGAVVSPGVYQLPAGSRLIDALEAAGGSLESASIDSLNLAAFLYDSSRIKVPTKEEAELLPESDLADSLWENGSLDGSSSADKQDLRVNINTADAALLCTLPGIGQTRAESILAYRKEHGAFSTIEEIMNVDGIKEGSFAKLKDRIKVTE